MANSDPPKRVISKRWAMENKDGITCYVYAEDEPTHFIEEGYTKLRRAGYYDYTLNVIVHDTEIPTVYIDERKAPGA